MEKGSVWSLVTKLKTCNKYCLQERRKKDLFTQGFGKQKTKQQQKKLMDQKIAHKQEGDAQKSKAMVWNHVEGCVWGGRGRAKSEEVHSGVRGLRSKEAKMVR